MINPDGRKLSNEKDCEGDGDTIRPIIFATLLHEQGETGVQTHMGVFREYLEGKGREVRILTPFSSPRTLVYPVFAVRRLIDPVSGPLSVWWYRYWHYRFLRLALSRELGDGRPKIVYAQCPLSAKAAMEARSCPEQRIVMAVHLNLSQALEWAEKGKIREKGFLSGGYKEWSGVSSLPSTGSSLSRGSCETRWRGKSQVSAGFQPSLFQTSPPRHDVYPAKEPTETWYP